MEFSHKTPPKKTSTEVSIQEVIQHTRLSALHKKSSELTKLTHIFEKILPEGARGQCQVAHHSPTTLTLHTAESALATWVRMMTPQIITHLKQHPPLAKLDTLKCKVNPSLARLTPETPTNSLTLSEDTKSLLQATAQCTSHPLLKAALLKLGKK